MEPYGCLWLHGCLSSKFVDRVFEHAPEMQPPVMDPPSYLWLHVFVLDAGAHGAAGFLAAPYHFVSIFGIRAHGATGSVLAP